MTNYVILCGGLGKKNENYSLPKPLNMINGKYLIDYVIRDIPSETIYIIYNYILKRYNFEYIVRNLFKNKTFHFFSIDYITRGPVETALVGCINFKITNDENIVFIDNDNIHGWKDVNMTPENNDFVFYSHDYTDSNRFSFINIDEQCNILDIQEKERISNNYCCGIYGFKNVSHFISSAKDLIENNIKQKNEFYFSSIYKNLISNNIQVIGKFIKDTKHLGSKNEIIENYLGSNNKLRICFDLDNTLVTYPETPGNYKTVKPIKENIDLCNSLHKQGHTIIIFTARRMLTHNHNVGKVIKDIGRITFDTLDEFNILYDEILFGKPIADIYIDDRALNPLVMDIGFFGLDGGIRNSEILNKMENNVYNTIVKKDKIIEKTGPNQFITGEIFFYENIHKYPDIECYFPKYYSKSLDSKYSKLSIEYIEGIPLYYLFSNNTMTLNIFKNLLNITNTIHSVVDIINIDQSDIYENYITKLYSRFSVKEDYPFDNSEYIFEKIINLHKDYISNKKYKLVPVIHGDLWFSNILLSYDDKLFLIDMKGRVGSKLTLNGDVMYDYGKIYQSLLGYDMILNDKPINTNLLLFQNYFEYYLKTINIDIYWIKVITLGLIFGTFHSIDKNKSTIRSNIWKLIESLSNNL